MDAKLAKDFTELGTRLEGQFENDRNAACADCFKKVIREVYRVTDVIIAHHLVYVREERHADGFMYEIIEEIPSADALIFDHDIAKAIWGENFKSVLQRLALEPVETRDALFRRMYEERNAETRAT